MTIIEKIISLHTKDTVSPGKTVWMDLDVRSARDFGGASVVKHLLKNYHGNEIADVSKTFFTFDCVAPAKDIAYANNQHICRKFATEKGIKVFDVDSGIGSHVLIEKGIAFPSAAVVGTDSHMNILGAIGALGQGMGDIDIAFAFRTGRTWFDVPETMKIILKGKPSGLADAKDIVLFMLKHLGSSGALGKAIELYGDIVGFLSLDQRITIASMATEMGAIAIFIQPDQEIVNHFKNISSADFPLIEADPDANYCKEIELDISGLPPLTACPPSPENVKTVKELKGTKIDSVFIGSCTNGRISDLEKTLDVMKGKIVHQRVMAKIVPATREVYAFCMEKGILHELFRTGFIISNAGCGGCASGQIGMTGKGEVQVSTSNRNFAGKQGSGDTYLASPATAAASAIAGEICSGEDL
jgi:3-isopropylmalate/(R)-2-methylmalate dehydratase large subunit